jgi:hypothetical protein
MAPADAAYAPSVPGTRAPGAADSGVDAGSTAPAADAAIGVTPEVLAAADWIAAENTRKASALYGKVALNKLGVGGHSIGSANAFIAGRDPRFATSVHVACGSLDNVNDPFATTTGQGGKAPMHPVAESQSSLQSAARTRSLVPDAD